GKNAAGGGSSETDGTLLRVDTSGHVSGAASETGSEPTARAAGSGSGGTSQPTMAPPRAARDANGLVGQALGQYQVIRELGHGAMGVVYLAEQVGLDRKVALKVLPQALALNKKTLERFRREAAAAAKLQHPNVVPVFGVGEAEGLHYFAMEFVEGATLADIIARERITFERAAGLVIQAAKGLAHGHERGVVHRDVKPANMMVTGEGRLMIADFGLAAEEEAETLTRTGDVMGTPAYMSPEQARGARAEIDARSDQYSLGVTLYEMLTLTRPFQADDMHAVLIAVVNDDPVPPRRVNAAVPRDLETIALKAMEKDKNRRYPDCGALAADLQRFLDKEPISARPISALGRAVRKVRKHRLVSALVAAFVAVVAGGGSYLFWAAEQAREQKRLEVAALVREAASLIARGQALESDRITDHDYYARATGLYDTAAGKDETDRDVIAGRATVKGLEERRLASVKEAERQKTEKAAQAQSLSESAQARVIVEAEEAKPPLDAADERLDEAKSLCEQALAKWTGNDDARSLKERVKVVADARAQAKTQRASIDALAAAKQQAASAAALRLEAEALRQKPAPADEGASASAGPVPAAAAEGAANVAAARAKFREAIDTFSDALTGVENAIFLWPENDEAQREHFLTAVAGADCAVEAGELGLAELLFARRAERFKRVGHKDDEKALSDLAARLKRAQEEQKNFTDKVNAAEEALRRRDYPAAETALAQALDVRETDDLRQKLNEARAGKLLLDGQGALNRGDHAEARRLLAATLAAPDVSPDVKEQAETATRTAEAAELETIAQRMREAVRKEAWDAAIADGAAAGALRGDPKTTSEVADLCRTAVHRRHQRDLAKTKEEVAYVPALRNVKLGSDRPEDRNP
ncbi:MAG: protein kinase, partial [Planctomycetes bacterium]|nr:protein kinase [Planctomycetota bacterium]